MPELYIIYALLAVPFLTNWVVIAIRKLIHYHQYLHHSQKIARQNNILVAKLVSINRSLENSETLSGFLKNKISYMKQKRKKDQAKYDRAKEEFVTGMEL